MKKIIKKIILPVFLILNLLIPNIILAIDAIPNAQPINVHVRIEEPNSTLLNSDINVPETCSIQDNNGQEVFFHNYNLICALEIIKNDYQINYSYYEDVLGNYVLNDFNNIQADNNNYWTAQINYNYFNDFLDLNSHSIINPAPDLQANDYLLFNLGHPEAKALKIRINNPQNNYYHGNTLNLQTQIWQNDNFVDFNQPVNFIINNQILATDNGNLNYTIPNDVNNLQIYVEANNQIRSEKIQINNITDQPIPEQNNLINIIYYNETIYSGPVNTTSTWFFDENNNLYTTSTISALGVLMSASRAHNFNVNIKNTAFGYYVNEIANHQAEGWDGWLYKVNDQQPVIGLNNYILQPNDNLTIYYNVWPWKITANTTSTFINQAVEFTTYNFNSENLNWQISPSTTIKINDNVFLTNASGTYSYTPISTTTIQAYIYDPNAENDWDKIKSPTLNIEVLDNNQNNNNDNNNNNDDDEQQDNGNNNGNNNGGGNNNDNNDGNDNNNNNNDGDEQQDNENNNQPTIYTQDFLQTKAEFILDYFQNQIDEQGKIQDGNITDWIIMSFAANNIYSQTIKNNRGISLIDFALNYDFSAPSELNLCASYPRHLLALLSSGVNKEKIKNLQTEILNCFNNNQYGQAGINDDVFALLALIAYNKNSNQDKINFLINKISQDQNESGAFTWNGFASPDISGAALNALVYAKNNNFNIDENIINKVNNYLRTSQKTDGGWSWSNDDNVSSDNLNTIWAIMGINAQNQTQTDWLNQNNHQPWEILVNNLNNQGYYESAFNPGTVDWFSTKHAVPALLGKNWPILLSTYEEPKQNNNNPIIINNQQNNDEKNKQQEENKSAEEKQEKETKEEEKTKDNKENNKQKNKTEQKQKQNLKQKTTTTNKTTQRKNSYWAQNYEKNSSVNYQQFSKSTKTHKSKQEIKGQKINNNSSSSSSSLKQAKIIKKDNSQPEQNINNYKNKFIGSVILSLMILTILGYLISKFFL